MTRFGGVIVWDGDNGAGRVFSTGNGFVSKDMRFGVIKGIAALTKEGESKDTVIDMEFQNTSVGANGYDLKM